ncbi:MAG: LuxR C-terminal-related transcriptional regulator [Blastocatellia bacterium]
MKPIQILLIEAHAIPRAALRSLIESQPSLEVVGEARNYREAFAIISRRPPDILLYSFDAHSDGELDGISKLSAAADNTRVLVLTAARDQDLYNRIMRAGARGVVLKDQSVSALVKAIKKINAGEAWLDRTTTACVLGAMSREIAAQVSRLEMQAVAALTAREREVVSLIAEGLKNRVIAERLFISEATVRHHISSIFAKLGVSDRVGLILNAFRLGLADPPH